MEIQDFFKGLNKDLENAKNKKTLKLLGKYARNKVNKELQTSNILPSYKKELLLALKRFNKLLKHAQKARF